MLSRHHMIDSLQLGPGGVWEVDGAVVVCPDQEQ